MKVVKREKEEFRQKVSGCKLAHLVALISRPHSGTICDCVRGIQLFGMYTPTLSNIQPPQRKCL